MLLEREEQLTALTSLVTGLDESGGRTILIRGEAGIGKSSLVRELIRRHGADTHVMFGTCDDLLVPQTLGCFWDIALLEPSLSDVLASDDRRRVQEATLDLMSRGLRPTLLVIEDTQWADEATLDVIKYLGRRILHTNGLLLLTYRDVEVDLDHPLRQVIGDLPPSTVDFMQLQPLSEDAVRQVVGDRPLDVASLLEQTDGNPLYVTEIVAWGSDGVPASIQEMVIARSSKATGETKALLEMVSVVPGEAERALLEAALDHDLSGLDAGIRLGLLRATRNTVAYVHELQRRAVEGSLSPERRRQLNSTVLEALGSSADPARLVHHAREIGDADAIVLYAPIAARAAMAADSSHDAVDLFRLVDPHLDRLAQDDAAAILYDWAQQEYYLHNTAAVDLAKRATDLLRTGGDPLSLGRALTLSARVNMRHLRTSIAVAEATEAVAVLEDQPDSLEYALALSTLAYVTWLYVEDVPASLEIVGRALEAAEASGHAEAEIQALRVKGNLQYSVGIAGGMELLERSRSLAAKVGNRDAETLALSNMTGMAADFRRMPLAIDLARRTLETAARYGMQAAEAQTSAMYAEILLWIGEWDKVEDTASAALGGQPYAETIAWRILATLQARRGRAEARTALDRMWALAESAEQLTVVDPAAAVLAEYMWLSGDRDPRWLESLDSVLAEGIEVGNPWPSGSLAFWMWKLGRLDTKPAGTFDFYGWIIDGEPQRAAEFWRERGIPYEEALSLMHCGQAEQLQALRIAEDIGAQALASRIRELLVSQGVTPPRGRGRATREHAAGLTQRQAEVLELLAGGHTNMDIADRLFVSPRTVENHVAAILMKLDVSTREDAVAIARDRQLI